MPTYSIDITSEDFELPAHVPATRGDILAALADLGAEEIGPLGWINVPLHHTLRKDGTIDVITVSEYGGTTDWCVYFGRVYRGRGGAGNVTSPVGQFPGWMAVLVVRALYSHVSTVGAAPLKDDPEGRILYALGLGPR